MIEFVLGRSGGGKTTYLDSLIASAKQQGKAVCLIVPEQESMMTERTCQQKYGESVEVLSFHRLCDALMRLYGGGAKARLGDVATLGILFRAVQAVKDKLTFYRKSASMIGFYEKLLPVMEDFAAYKADAKVILPLLADSPIYAKYQDLFLIYESFNALRKQDYRHQFDDLDTALAILKEHSYFENRVVLVDHFGGFTEQEYAILECIFLQAESVALTLTADESEAGLFAPTLSHLRRLVDLAQSYGLKYKKTLCNNSYRYKSDNLRVLEKHLFASSVPAQKVSGDESVRIFCAATMEDEVRMIASDIRRRVLGGECRYKDISVVSNVQDQYQHVVEMIFDEMDIPLYSDRKVDVLSRPLFSMILHAFDAVEYGYRFEDMFSLAKTYLCGLDYESVARLENYAYIWNIRGKKWEMEWTQSPFGLESGDDELKEKLLTDINESREHLVTPLIEFAEDTRPGKATDLLAAVWRLIENFGVTKQLADLAKSEESRDKAEQWLRLYDLLISMLDQLALVLGEGQITRKELHDIMEVCLRGYRFGVVPAFMDQVHFGDMVRARSGEVAHLYVLGAAHGSFPAGVSGSQIITDRDIRRLKQQNILLSKDSVSVAMEQQFCLYRTVASACQSVTFSYSSFAADGSACLPSVLLERICDKLIDVSILSDPKRITHPRDLVRFCLHLPRKSEKYLEIAAFLKKNFDIDVDLLQTPKKKDEPLSKAIVEALYSKELSASQTRLESFVGCPFKFFLDYGLRIEETEQVTFAARFIGDFVHFGMERLLGAVALDGDLEKWDEGRVDELLSETAQEYFENNLKDMSSPRFAHLYDRICKTMSLVGHSALDELRHSKFVPVKQEYRFERKLPLSDGFVAKINGSVDRVDCAEIDGEKWLKVVDYKTGDKALELSKIYNGYQLQLPLYAKMLTEQPEFQGYNIAAMEYFLAGVPTFAQGQEITAKSLAGNFLRKGLFVSEKPVIKSLDTTEEGLYNNASIKKDGTFSSSAMVASREELSALGDFVENKVKEIMQRMVSGDVSVCPMKQGINACQYCDYSGICRFEYGKSKIATYKQVGSDEFFDLITKGEE